MLVTTSQAGRLTGVWVNAINAVLEGAAAIGWVGKAIAGMGRLLTSWGSKKGILGSIIRGVSEVGFLMGAAAALSFAGAPWFVPLVFAGLGTVGALSGSVGTKLLTDGEEQEKKLLKIAERVEEQNFMKPDVLIGILEYIDVVNDKDDMP